jgi:hypothetical protein
LARAQRCRVRSEILIVTTAGEGTESPRSRAQAKATRASRGRAFLSPLPG